MEKTGFQREKTQLQLESIKMVKEWSTWLAGLQTGICALLWGPLKDNPAFTGEIGSEKLVAGIWLYFAWYSFLISLVLTVLMLGTLPRIIEELGEAENPDESIFNRKVGVGQYRVPLKTALAAIYGIFIAGVVFSALFVLVRKPG